MTFYFYHDILVNIIFQSLDLKTPKLMIESLDLFMNDLESAEEAGILLPDNHDDILITSKILWFLICDKI